MLTLTQRTCAPLSRPWSLFAAGLLVATAAGCPSPTTQDGKTAAQALEPRDTTMEHENCDLDGSGAKPLDADGDGTPDVVEVFEGSQLTCRAVDFNTDGVIDLFVYFDASGQQRRRESGFDRDTLPDEIAYFEGGQLVRKERETNNDRKIDTWDYYEGGRLTREERDSTGDGFVDQWWVFDRPDFPDCATVTTDADGDGRPDEGSEVDTCRDKPGAKDAPPKASPAPQSEPEPEPEPSPDSEDAEAADENSPADGGGGGAEEDMP